MGDSVVALPHPKGQKTRDLGPGGYRTPSASAVPDPRVRLRRRGAAERVRGTLDVSANELVPALRSVALALEESTRMLVRITDLHEEAAGMHAQLAEALADLELILARLEEKEP